MYKERKENVQVFEVYDFDKRNIITSVHKALDSQATFALILIAAQAIMILMLFFLIHTIRGYIQKDAAIYLALNIITINLSIIFTLIINYQSNKVIIGNLTEIKGNVLKKRML